MRNVPIEKKNHVSDFELLVVKKVAKLTKTIGIELTMIFAWIIFYVQFLVFEMWSILYFHLCNTFRARQKFEKKIVLRTLTWLVSVRIRFEFFLGVWTINWTEIAYIVGRLSFWSFSINLNLALYLNVNLNHFTSIFIFFNIILQN